MLPGSVGDATILCVLAAVTGAVVTSFVFDALVGVFVVTLEMVVVIVRDAFGSSDVVGNIFVAA